jgi:hypothetical protein
MNIEREMQKLEHTLGSMAANYAQQIIQKSKNQEQKCFADAKDDSEKFVNCMLPVMKRFSKNESTLEFGLAFTRVRTYECFEKTGGEPLSIEECKVKASETIKKHYENFISKL